MISSPNRAELLASILGGLWANASVLPVSPGSPESQLVEIARLASVSTVIGEDPTLEALSGHVAQRLPLSEVELGKCARTNQTSGGSAGSILLQSSGTTGMPKLVRRCAASLDSVAENCRCAIDIRASDSMLVAIPLYHSYGIDQAVLSAITAGCGIELHRRFESTLVKSALAERGITLLPGVPLMFDSLARTGRDRGSAPVLRRAFSAGSPLPRRVFDQFQRVYAVRIGQIYGTTEFGSVTFNDPDLPDFVPENAGRPMTGVEIRIVDTDEPRIDQPVPPGIEGQVAVAAPSMLSEFVGSSSCPTTGGFLLTGDLGRLDECGTLRLTGRLDLLVDVGGLKVNPVEVESVLTRHPAVREAVAVPIPFSDTAWRLKAIIIPEPGCEITRDELRRLAQEHLIHHKVPRSFEIRTTVPRSPTGKILRKALQASARRARS
jgi:long-chain acyl-CoA synthetase